MAKKAVMYGAGSIGRGFIGQLFSESGYETIFIDVNEELIRNLNERGQYSIRFVKNSGSSHTFSYTYENVRIANEIASADAKITVKIDPTQVSEVILAP